MSEKGGRLTLQKKGEAKILSLEKVKTISENSTYITLDFEKGGIAQFSTQKSLSEFPKEVFIKDAKYNMFGNKINKI